MSEIYLGIDSGTQSTKVVALDLESGIVLAQASSHYDLIPGLPAGHKEQDPATWISAIRIAMGEVLKSVPAAQVRGIGVSGQQHGFVPLDAAHQVIRPAKLWCDTATADECSAIISRLGGLEKAIHEVGNGVPAGFTASKILWLRNHEPENYSRLKHVLLPHDYINFWLTGRLVMEPGDASGTALLDVRQRKWSKAAIDSIDPAIAEALPELVDSGSVIGQIRTDIAAEFGLPSTCLVSAGGGDNMMGAIGTGNVSDGTVTISLGTSGTIFASSSKPVIDPLGEVAAFCDSTGQWLPLVCTMNVTVATEMVRSRYSLSHSEFDAAVSSTPAGNDGLLLVPYFEGERTPDQPDGTGVYFGLRQQTFSISHFARAAMEGTALGLNYGLNRLRQLGISPSEIRATGGGSKSPVWRQILADVFNAEVVCVSNDEGAAVGAAVQAAWAVSGARRNDLLAIAGRVVGLAEETRKSPNPEAVSKYQSLQEIQDELSNKLRSSFALHRRFIED